MEIYVMNNYKKKLIGIIFVASLIIVVGFTFSVLLNETSSQNTVTHETITWRISIDQTNPGTDSLGVLTRRLYEETRGERRADILEPVIAQISDELEANYRSTPLLLTELLRDLSLEHPANQVRKSAYRTMITVLHTEYDLYESHREVVRR